MMYEFVLKLMFYPEDKMHFQVAQNYIKMCYKTFSYDQVSTLLSEDATFRHSTNEQIGINASGRDNVALLIKKLLFDDTANLVFQGCNFKPQDNKQSLCLTVTFKENRKENEIWNRYKYVDTTLLEFKIEEEKPVLIQRIEIAASRTLLKENV